MLREGCDVAAQRDAVVGILVSGEQSVCWRRWRVVQGDHVACDGGWVDGRRGIRCVRCDLGQGSRRGSKNLDRCVSRGGEAREGCRLVRGLDRRWCPAPHSEECPRLSVTVVSAGCPRLDRRDRAGHVVGRRAHGSKRGSGADDRRAERVAHYNRLNGFER